MNRSTVLLAALAIFAAACEQGTPTETKSSLTPVHTNAAITITPRVAWTFPGNGSTGFSRTHSIAAHFSVAMDPTTITTNTFTLQNGNRSVKAVVTYVNQIATLNPNRSLDAGTLYTATVTTDVQSGLGVNMAQDKVWTFTTATASAGGPAVVNLGTAGNYVILSKAGVSTTGVTSVVGDIGVSPVAGSSITGFAMSAPPSTYTTSALVTGHLFAANFDAPTPANLTTAILDMQTAYTDAAGRVLPDFINLGAGNIQGMTLVPGLYKWGTGLQIPSAVTLSGGSNDVWIFQIAGKLTVGNGAIVTLTGGAQARNIFWQTAGGAILGTTVQFKGIILSKTLITLNTGAHMTGRALAQTAVTLNATTIGQQ